MVTIRTETHRWRRAVKNYSKDILYSLPRGSLPQLISSGSVYYKIQIVITGTRALIKVLGHQHRWLAGDYDLEIGHFRGG